MQRLRRQLEVSFADSDIAPQFRSDFRSMSLPLMKYTNILSFNWRTIALFCSLFACMPWLYFAFELVVLNALLIYMMYRHEAFCAKLTQDLKDGKYSRP